MWQEKARFCPLCGDDLALAQVGGRARKACGACGFVLYTGPAGAAAGVVLDEHRQVLLVQRSIEPFRGHWALPAGYQEIDESPAEALVREIREETGIEVVVEALLDLQHVPDDPRKPANVAIYLCHPREPGCVPRAGDDAADARWFSLDAIPADLGFPNNRRILEALGSGDGYPLPLPPDQAGGSIFEAPETGPKTTEKQP